MDLLHALNPHQKEAVSAPPCHCLVLAGAGSGKTRVLVHRIAWLIQENLANAHSIMAVTFTNKAAGEMRHRLSDLIGPSAQSMWVGTFHGLAHRMLRMHWQEAGLPQEFQILDSEDQARMVKRVLKDMDLSDEKWPPKQVQSFINHEKDKGIRPHHISAQDYYGKTMRDIYMTYEQACQNAGVIDFAEILLRAHELFLNNTELLAHYQNRFRHILVDEFQDTNTIQYAWIRLMAGEHIHVMVVGDDDQSIYGWRGAKVENIHRFQEDFGNVHTIRLEQNYRSTGNILKAANAVIDNNGSRMGKTLWTDGGDGHPILIYTAMNEVDEARYVANQIETWSRKGGALKEVAILYRSNAQSRVIEESLMRARLAYRVYGGLRFFERAEIKDILSYLRLMMNKTDDGAFDRIVNLPTRGIGEKTLEELRAYAKSAQISLWEASRNFIENRTLAARAHQALEGFLQLIDELAQTARNLDLPEAIRHVMQGSGLWDHHANGKEREKAEARVENMQELINAARQFRMDEYESDGVDTGNILTAFLSHVALDAGVTEDTNAEDYEDNKVQLMTIHSAKGLEFPLVFIVGMEEGLFPGQRSVEDPDRLEEERRLFYVGMTRAMRQLVLCHAEVRRQYGREEYHKRSRFLKELPPEVVDDVRGKSAPTSSFSRPQSTFSGWSATPKAEAASSNPWTNAVKEEAGWRLGESVSHPKFGEGVIIGLEGSGANLRIQIKFKAHGIKWLVLAYAQLTKG